MREDAPQAIEDDEKEREKKEEAMSTMKSMKIGVFPTKEQDVREVEGLDGGRRGGRPTSALIR